MGNDLAHLRQQITDLLRFKAKAAIQSGRKVTYELGDKCSKLLAGKLKERSSTTYIPHIKGRDGQLIALPKDIAKTFGEFYSSLYNLTPPSSSPSVLEEYLSSSCLARLPSPVRSSLEAPITIEELMTVIKTVKSGKAPGPDGFTLQYYKNYLSVLGAHMIKMFNALGQTTTLPPRCTSGVYFRYSKGGERSVRMWKLPSNFAIKCRFKAFY